MAKFYAKAPDGTDATLSITVEGFTQSLQQNGWCKMPNGLILQWLETPSSLETVSFPIAFTANIYSAELCFISPNIEYYLACATYQPTLNNAVFYARAINGPLVKYPLFCTLLGY